MVLDYIILFSHRCLLSECKLWKQSLPDSFILYMQSKYSLSICHMQNNLISTKGSKQMLSSMETTEMNFIISDKKWWSMLWFIWGLYIIHNIWISKKINTFPYKRIVLKHAYLIMTIMCLLDYILAKELANNFLWRAR